MENDPDCHTDRDVYFQEQLSLGSGLEGTDASVAPSSLPGPPSIPAQPETCLSSIWALRSALSSAGTGWD